MSLAPVASTPTVPSFGIALGYLGNDLFAEPAEASTHLTIASVSVCPFGFETGGTLFVTPCAAVRGGFLEARGLGVSNPAWAVRTYWSLGVEATIALRLGGGFFAELAPALDFPLVKRRFVAGRPPAPVGETPVVSPALGVGIGYHFQ
jgi:hypothetical protein